MENPMINLILGRRGIILDRGVFRKLTSEDVIFISFNGIYLVSIFNSIKKERFYGTEHIEYVNLSKRMRVQDSFLCRKHHILKIRLATLIEAETLLQNVAKDCNKLTIRKYIKNYSNATCGYCFDL